MDDITRLLINLRTVLTWLEDAHRSRTMLVVAVAAENEEPGQGHLLHTFASPAGPEPEGVAAVIAHLHHSFEAGAVTHLDAEGHQGGGTHGGTAPRGICIVCGESHGPDDPCEPPLPAA